MAGVVSGWGWIREQLVTAASANFTAGKAVEVTFLDQVTLPVQVEISDSVFGPWQSL